MRCTSSTADKPTASDTSPANNADQGKSESLDYSKINALVENINQRLTGGLHGSFLERGSKLDDDKRYVQLPMFFELRDELDSLKKKADKSSQRTADMDDDKQAKASTGKPSGSMTATVNRIVEQQLEPKMRDFQIKIDRVNDALAKAQATIVAMEDKNKTLEGKIRKPETNALETKFDNKIANLAKKVSVVESNVPSATEMAQMRASQSTTNISKLAWDLSAVESETTSLRDGMRRMIETTLTDIRDIRSTQTSHRTRLDEIERVQNEQAEDEDYSSEDDDGPYYGHYRS